MTRRIRSLRLRGGTAADQQRATHLVADALRTASLPGLTPGRVLVVRRLDLGAVSPGRASQALALRITDQVRRVGRLAAAGGAPEAQAAPAVWFADRAAARARFLARRAVGPAPREWYWAGAVADPRSDDPLPALLVRWLAPPARLSAAEPPPMVAAARQVQAIVALGPAVARAVLAALPPTAAARWVRPPSAALPEVPAHRLAPPADPAWTPVLRWAASQAPPVATWVALAAVISADPVRSARPDGVAAARALLREHGAAPSPVPPVPGPLPALAPPTPSPMPAERAPPPASPRSPPAPDLAEPSIGLAPAGAPPSLRRPALSAAAPSGAHAAAQRTPAPPRSPPLGPHRARLPPPPPLVDPAATAFGGLLFLANPLVRLGLGAVAAQPELGAQGFGWRVIDALAARLGALRDEPVLRAVAPPTPPAPLDDADYVAPAAWWARLFDAQRLIQAASSGGVALIGDGDAWLARWRGPLPDALAPVLQGRRVVPGPPLDGDAAAAAHADLWAAAAVRWCDRVAALDAAAVAAREGIVSATPTHVDVVLPARAVALPVRRWALDADPGWVPWLGRVVAFHYAEDDDFDAARAGLGAARSPG